MLVVEVELASEASGAESDQADYRAAKCPKNDFIRQEIALRVQA